MTSLRFSVDGKQLDNGALRNDDITTAMWFASPSFPQPQIQSDLGFLRFQILQA